MGGGHQYGGAPMNMSPHGSSTAAPGGSRPAPTPTHTAPSFGGRKKK
jgi:hypothetical protein